MSAEVRLSRKMVHAGEVIYSSVKTTFIAFRARPAVLMGYQSSVDHEEGDRLGVNRHGMACLPASLVLGMLRVRGSRWTGLPDDWVTVNSVQRVFGGRHGSSHQVRHQGPGPARRNLLFV